MPADAAGAERSWWVLVHQLPPEPPALRVRVWRRLQALGALPLKSSVYLLPDGEETREDFEWLVREIEAGGAEATLLRATLGAGATDDEVVARFRAAAATEYDALIVELRTPVGRKRRRGHDESVRLATRLRARFEAIARRDFFAADGGETAAALLEALERRERGESMPEPTESEPGAVAALRGKTWTTRADVHVDRMASAWLVRRFVDPDARFRFVAARRIDPAPDEVRFDTFGGEFTHVGERCTFETLCLRLGLTAPGLAKIGEIVHDLDLKDDAHGHAENAGVAAALDGIVATTADDLERIDRASVLFDGLLAQFAKR